MASKDPSNLQIDVEEAQTAFSKEKRGGWITFPFILGCKMGTTVALFGVTSNFIVYLVKQFNVDGIDATQIFNIINGCINLSPIAGAVISDSFLGCFAVIAASSVLSFLGMVLFILTATVRSLRPPACVPGSHMCKGPSAGQSAVLYLAVALASAGTGGMRFNLATMGANQFDGARDQNVFFNWYFFVLFVASIIGSTAVVYVQDNVGWGWGFGVCAAANAAAVFLLLLGARYYRGAAPEGSPYVGLARVLVATARKWRAASPSPEIMEYYTGSSSDGKQKRQVPTGSFRLLNRAALKAPGDTNADGSLAKPWSLCTVHQVEDLKAILRILPIWSSSIFLSISQGILFSLSVLQALSLDRRLGPHFFIPPGSVSTAVLATSAVSLPLLDRCLYPSCRRLLGRAPTPLQRVGAGHIVNLAAMATAALVEWRRLGAVRSLGRVRQPGAAVPMSVMWLLPPLAAVGVGEAFHFPGQVTLYYREFPETLRSSATGMIGLAMAVGFYTSTAVVDLVRRVTDWLPEDINAAKLDRVYWMLAIVGTLNLGFYLLCAALYSPRDAAEPERSTEETRVNQA